ncbi:Histone deacetylase [Ignisphaera aggregans DSM 17230]|uniref:Histone deacetylase n=1 Tax=Ignisphaera aggregans (strain DSM 17230 / JCM 13409 / AQ1.S1) TaxID=583356 RepID=E0SR82_IGNAA|nr:Histone deacetylase [Ignisphaera aggregans DSM 17230]
MSIHIFFSEILYRHRPPRNIYHPENPSRLDIALKSIKEIISIDNRIKILDSNVAEFINYIRRIHDYDYVEYIYSLCLEGDTYIDSDTYISRDSCRVAEKAIGLSVRAMNEAIEHRETLAFALVRPPGHHAGIRGRAMDAPTQGFCIFNNIAATTIYALDRGYSPIAIIDIDVHHGNGTQEIFWYDPRVIHIDIHEYGIYPGTGYIDEIGGKGAEGTKINIPLPPYSGDDDYLYIVREIVLPIIYSVKPKIIAISAGFDAYRDDGLADMEVTTIFYESFGKLLRFLSRDISVMGVLEGGYSIGIENGFSAFLKGFLKGIDCVDKLFIDIKPSDRVINIVSRVKNILKPIYTTWHS